MRRGVDAFVPERLTQILAARRLSQVQLAQLAGVSATTISKWRTGAQSPEPDALTRLASVVNVEPEWFTRPLHTRNSPPLFRSNASAHVAARAMLEARLQWAQDTAAGIQEFVDFPELRLPERDFTDPEAIAQLDIEFAADECRDLWKLGRGPLQDVMLAAESAGVIVVREETGTAQIEGLSAWSESLGRPIVLLCADKANGFRSRFDLAHEIGHLVLHKHIERTSEAGRHKLMERQAHQFAGALLLPAQSFARDVRLPCTLDDLLLLKMRWGVSVGAIAMRLHALGIINDDDKQSLFKRRSARWGSKAEPNDKDRDPEVPRLLRRSVDLMANAGVMPLEALPKHLGLSAFDVESLTSLPEGYLSGRGTVLELAKLRTTTVGDARANGMQTAGSNEDRRDGRVLAFPGRRTT